MKERFTEFVKEELLSERDIDLEAYSYDASGIKIQPKLLIWPETIEGISHMMKYCTRINVPVYVRGKGTGVMGASVGEGVVVDCSRLNGLSKIDLKQQEVELGAGTTLTQLNTLLHEHGLYFPCIPLLEHCTVGGLIATNPSYYGERYFGKLEKFVVSVTGVEGTGQFPDIKPEHVLGTEGTTAIMLKLRLKVTDLILQKSFTVKHFDQLPSALNYVSELKKKKDLIGAILTTGIVSELAGSSSPFAVLAEFASENGEIIDITTRNIVEGRFKNLLHALSERDYVLVEDCKVGLDKLYDLSTWCKEQNLPMFSFADLGVCFVKFTKKQQALRDKFRIFVKFLNGEVGSCFGHGRLRKKFVSGYKSNKLFTLKERMDYNNILGRGVVIDYK